MGPAAGRCSAVSPCRTSAGDYCTASFCVRRVPSQLSGGQRQRVALARALAVQPKVLLLDEPFGALDARVRQELRGWLRNLQKELGITTVMVTHDQEEAMEVADRIVIMNEGRIEQVGSPNELWDHPANPFVFDFLGNSNLFHGIVRSGFIELPGWKMRSNGWPEAGEVDVGVRTFDVRIAPSRNGSGRVKRLVSSGEFVRLEIELPHDKRLNAQIHKCDPSLIGVSEGTPIRVEPLKVFVFSDRLTMGVPTSVH
ncbi:ATP-binding cassette domain-containing protein [bacterium]|nr:ATP-binding cassette domain-containing protein [bacterium]